VIAAQAGAGQKKAARLTVRPKSREETPKEGSEMSPSRNAQFIVRRTKCKVENALLQDF
jgi:hypothetical protein